MRLGLEGILGLVVAVGFSVHTPGTVRRGIRTAPRVCVGGSLTVPWVLALCASSPGTNSFSLECDFPFKATSESCTVCKIPGVPPP